MGDQQRVLSGARKYVSLTTAIADERAALAGDRDDVIRTTFEAIFAHVLTEQRGEEFAAGLNEWRGHGTAAVSKTRASRNARAHGEESRRPAASSSRASRFGAIGWS
jgi:hypothetical protein